MEFDVNHMKMIIRDLKGVGNNRVVAKLELDKCERIVDRLGSFSTDCEECQHGLAQLETHFLQLKDKSVQLDASDYKQHKLLIAQQVSHLQKVHKLLPDGYYMSIYMSLGMGLGVVFGLTPFDNIALGLPLGMCLGIAIGTGLDSDAKKKGKTI